MTTVPSKTPSWLRLALNQSRRDLLAGELRLLALAVALAVAALTAVAFFADRLSAGLSRDARQLLGGDAIVASDQRTPQTLIDLALESGLTTARTAAFPSMARAPDARGGQSRLVAVKAVSEGYPLRGRVQVRSAPDGPARVASQAPQRGTVWVDPALLDALGLAVGEELLLGEASLKVSALVAVEPDRGAGFMSFAPRVMLHEDDLPATGLVQAASRVTWRLAVAGSDAAVSRFVRQAEQRIAATSLRGVRVESMEAGRPEMRQTLDRAEMFLRLVSLLAALLAAVAVGIASRDFAQRHLDDCAILRVLGLPQRAIAGAYAMEFALVGLLASAAGIAAGWAVHHGFVWLLSGLVQADLPAAGLRPALFGLGVGMTLLAAFGLPPVLQLSRVPPLRVIRRDLGTPKAMSVGVLVAGVVGFGAMLLFVAGNATLGLIAVGGFAAAVAVFALMGWLAVQALRALVPQASAPRWLVLATRQVTARPGFAVLQVAALAVGLLALVLLVLLRTDLIGSWRRATPPDAPNRFVINIQPEQTEAFKGYLKSAGVQRYDWYPMFRGRLVSINDKPVTARDFGPDRAQRLVEREFNLSHSAVLPDANPVVAGRWQPEEPEGLSVEEGLAGTLGLKLGDRLGFDVAGQVQQGRITSLRKVDWGSMRVNFFVLFPQSAMPEVPLTWIAAFRAPPQRGFDSGLTRAFPNVTNVDVSASIAQVQRVLDQVIRAVEFLFAFTLAAGLVVLFAAVSATRPAREREQALMRAMGAGRRLLAQVQRAELLGVGALAGLLASIGAVAVGGVLARQAFEFDWNPSPWVPLAGTLAGALLALASGWWSLRGVLARPVAETLRRASAE